MTIIGERVNATRKRIREAIQSRASEVIIDEIRSQEQSGAEYIDLNAGTGSGDKQQEKTDLAWLIDIALEHGEKKLALDAAGPQVLEHAANHLANRRPWMLNSITGELTDGDLAMIKLAAEYEVPLIALAMDEDGIPAETGKRIAVCEKIRDAAGARGVPEERLWFDPLVLPVSTDVSQATVTFRTIEGLRAQFPSAGITLGLSNVSHGLTKRAVVNAAFLTSAICYGLTSAICDPGREEISRAIVLGELLAGKDRFCRRFTRAARNGLFDVAPPEGALRQ